ncbi:MAG: type II toxin-antitoxin system RatA family toxin [Pseudomarimonas sp.]
MSRVERSALVRCSAQQMFTLVNEVEGYPPRFNWCADAHVLERTGTSMLARLDLRLGALRASFSTRNTWTEYQRIELALVDGPFSALHGSWQFDALAENACRVSLRLEFDFAGRLVGGALASGFRGLADRMVDDFVAAARREVTVDG